MCQVCTRRNFIRVSSAAIGSLALRPFGLLPALAQSPTDYRALVCVFLFGGNDSNNTVVPMDSSFSAYTSIRGSLALTTSQLTAPVASASGPPVSFHNQLPGLASLYASKELAVVANVGPLVQPLTRPQYQQQQLPIPLNLFSHSDQQLAWQTSAAQGRSPTGWAGRAADYLAQAGVNASRFPAFFSVAGNVIEGTGTSTQPVAVSPGQSLQLTGFNSSEASQARYNALTALVNEGSGLALVQAADDTLAHSLSDANALSAALAKATPLKTPFPTNTSLGAQLQQVAQIIQVQSYLGMSRQIFFASLGGFDTHANETATLNTLYAELSAALAAFYNATQELGVAQNVVTFTESDFSRTFQPTTTDGSDHAWGSHQLVLGGAVQGGQIFGKFPTFQLGGPDDTDVRGRWIPTISIEQYGATMCSWFGIPASAFSVIFPNLANFSTSRLGFLG
jgi:uncharacterized protein (DUF1501 family)